MSVTARRGHCTRRDYEYNLPTINGRETCKHYERVLFAIGREPVPAAFSPADVLGPPGGKHLEGESEFLVTDSGVPDHVTELSGFGDSDGFVCCDCCGATGDTVNEVSHHGDCPAGTTDGGGIDTTPATDEIIKTGEPVTVPVSGVLCKITQTERNRVTGILPVIERSSCLVQRAFPIGEVTPPKHVGSFPCYSGLWRVQ